MPRMYCVKCGRQYRCKKNGVSVQFGPGFYRQADLWECPECEHKVIAGESAGHTAEPYGPVFEVNE